MLRWSPRLLLFCLLLGVQAWPRPPSTPHLSPEQIASLLGSNQFSQLDEYLAARQREYDSGAITEEDLRNTFRAFYPTERSLRPAYDRWVLEFPKSYCARLARAIYLQRVAIEERGGAYSDRTSDDQLRKFEEGLLNAKQDLDTSLHLEAKPILSYVHEIDVAGSLQAPDRGRSYLDRAIKLDHRTFIARARYMGNLQTRWGGSLQLMQRFFRECQAAQLSTAHLNLLESILHEEEGWLHLHDDEDPAAAREAYQLAAALNPDLCLDCFYRELSDLLVKQHKYGEAMSLMSDILSKNPSDSKALLGRGWAYMHLGKANEAVADWERAAQLGNADAESEIGRAYMTGIPGVLQPNRATGIEWFRKSAAQGSAAGKANLAIATGQSNGGP